MRAEVGWLNGVVVATKTGYVLFDPGTKWSSRGSCSFISHAHSDHIGRLNSKADSYLTIETKDILSKVKYNVSGLDNCVALRYGDSAVVDDLDVVVHNSGHVLGSAQYEIRDSESSIVYTGDLNCREMLTTRAADHIACDTLILETTYGRPSYIFPSQSEIHADMINWAIDEIQNGKIPTFMVYSVGKAQEVVKIFNEFTNIPIVTSHSISRVNEAYEKNGVKLEYIDANSEAGREALKQSCVWVITRGERSLTNNRCSFAIASGWALKFRMNSVDIAFPLSGHADFSQLVEYVTLTKPKEVFTTHGFKKEFANYLSRKLDIRAREIPPLKQSSLRAFI